jgi:hypothetical protein
MGLKYHYRRKKKSQLTIYTATYSLSRLLDNPEIEQAHKHSFSPAPPLLTRTELPLSPHGVGGGAIATSELPLPLASLGQEEDGDGLHCCLDDDGGWTTVGRAHSSPPTAPLSRWPWPWRAWAALVTIAEGRFFSNSLNLD